MKRLTAFSFGYWGWGNSTEHFVQAVDAVERSRGFKPPIFVDIRINRSVRANGFNGNTFSELLGPNRYVWMKRLGNRQIRDRDGVGIKIDDPSAAEDLLDLTVEAAKNDRRVVFFCACEWPKIQGKVKCHRVRVATLLRLAASRRRIKLETVEWPGDKPSQFDLFVDEHVYRAVVRGKWTIPIGHPRRLADWAGIPWGSIVNLCTESESLTRVVGPVKWQTGEWVLPILWWFTDPSTGILTYKTESESERCEMGLLPCESK